MQDAAGRQFQIPRIFEEFFALMCWGYFLDLSPAMRLYNFAYAPHNLVNCRSISLAQAASARKSTAPAMMQLRTPPRPFSSAAPPRT